MTSNRKVLFVVNCPIFFVSHRLPIAKKLIESGCEVHLAALGNELPIFKDIGISFHQVNLSRDGTNPLNEFKVIWQLFRLFKELQPNIVHLVTIKPYLYGGIAARLAKIPAVVSAVSGLGVVFITSGLKAKLLRAVLYPLYKLAFGHKNQVVIFQNHDDADLLVNWGVVKPSKVKLIRGSGVDLTDYLYAPESEGTVLVTFAARLLADKGIREFIEASQIIQNKGVEAEFWIAGDVDEGNPASVTKKEVDTWRMLPNVKVLGFQIDIADLYQKSNIVCLPSYREGLPKSLVEAAACGRSVVTTDVPGCRDAIEPDVTGVLVPIRDSKALADAIEDLINHPQKRKQLGQSGRALAESAFAIEKIVDAHIQIYESLLNNAELI
jgi:glycosyltransferase involved in cell wall biosynthesis